jgi:hypothetical protein
MRVLLSMYMSHGSQASRGDVEPRVGLAVQLRTLQACGAAMPVYAPPDCAELLDRAGLPLMAGGMTLVAVGQPMLRGGWR